VKLAVITGFEASDFAEGGVLEGFRIGFGGTVGAVTGVGGAGGEVVIEHFDLEGPDPAKAPESGDHLMDGARFGGGLGLHVGEK
jgi:hypothetical protein